MSQAPASRRRKRRINEHAAKACAGVSLWGALKSLSCALLALSKGASAATHSMPGPLSPSVGSLPRRRLDESTSFPTFCEYGAIDLPVRCQQPSSFVLALPRHLRAIYSGMVWRSAQDADPLLPPDEELELPFTFDNPLYEQPPAYDSGVAYEKVLLPAPLIFRPVCRQVMSEVAALTNLRFREIPNGTRDTTILTIRAELSNYDAGAQVIREPEGHATMTLFPSNLSGDPYLFAGLFRHELMHFLGGRHPFDGINDNVTLPVGLFPDTYQSTALSYNVSCNGYTRSDGFGPLDLFLLSTAYGLRPPTAPASHIDLRDDARFISIISLEGNRTLRAISEQPAVLSLLADGSIPSRVGRGQVLLAPPSKIFDADLRFAAGGYLIGNNGNNRLWAGAGRTLVDGRRGNDTVFAGPGEDTVVLRKGSGLLTVVDFEPGRDQIASLVDGPEPEVIKRQVNGSEWVYLAFVSGEQISLRCRGINTFSLARDLNITNPMPDLGPCVLDYEILPPAPLRLLNPPPLTPAIAPAGGPTDVAPTQAPISPAWTPIIPAWAPIIPTWAPITPALAPGLGSKPPYPTVPPSRPFVLKSTHGTSQIVLWVAIPGVTLAAVGGAIVCYYKRRRTTLLPYPSLSV